MSEGRLGSVEDREEEKRIGGSGRKEALLSDSSR